jgi:hypothetical protein
MANLKIKNIDEAFYGGIKALADSENRSIGRRVLPDLGAPGKMIELLK